MEKAEHGARLRAAMATRGHERADVVAATGVAARTVTNWTTGQTLPSDRERAVLRKLYPGYDDPGDPVEIAVRNSTLTEDRQHLVLGTYKRLLREQDEGVRGAG